MARILIAGDIVDTETQRATFEDVTPSQVSSFVKGLKEGEGLELEITSYGGSVPSGLAICNMLRRASAEGHRTTAHVIGIAASMASAVACACDELRIDSNAFLMIHNPWTYVVGDAEDMRKEAETLDKMRDAIIAIYRTKFALDDEAIRKLMDEETWILGKDAETIGLSAEIIPTDEPLRAAAVAGKQLPRFLHVPQAIANLLAEKAAAKTEEVKADKPAEPEMIAKAECEKRVSGMQSAMARQIDALRKEHEAKIAGFENQLKAKDEELTAAKAEVTRLSADLESEKAAHAELSAKTSTLETALAEKTDALATLNAGVLTPGETSPDSWRNLRGQAFFDWLRDHPELARQGA